MTKTAQSGPMDMPSSAPMEKSGYAPATRPATGARRGGDWGACRGGWRDWGRGCGACRGNRRDWGRGWGACRGDCGACRVTPNRPLAAFQLSTRTGMDTAGAVDGSASTGQDPVRKRSRMASKQRRWRGDMSFQARCSSCRTAESSPSINWRLSRGTDSPRSIRSRQSEHFALTWLYQSSASSHTRCWADAKNRLPKSRKTVRYRFKRITVQR